MKKYMKNQTGQSEAPRDELARAGGHYLPLRKKGQIGGGDNNSIQRLEGS